MINIARRRDFPGDDRWMQNEFSTFFFGSGENISGKISDNVLKARWISLSRFKIVFDLYLQVHLT